MYSFANMQNVTLFRGCFKCKEIKKRKKKKICAKTYKITRLGGVNEAQVLKVCFNLI
jgi:hypothetical protein